MLRGAASRVGPLALRLREETCYFQEGAHLKRGGSVNDTTPVRGPLLGEIPCIVPWLQLFHGEKFTLHRDLSPQTTDVSTFWTGPRE